MADAKLIEYLDTNVKAGHPIDALKKTLIAQGWDKSIVDNAAKGIKSSPKQAVTGRSAEPKESKEPGTRPIGITLLSIVGFLASVLLILVGFVILAGSFVSRDALVSVILPIISGLLLPLGIEAGTLLSGGLMVAALVFVAILVSGFGAFLFWAHKKLWNMQKKGLFIIMGFYVLNAVRQIFSSERNYISILICLAVLTYLFLTRQRFK